MGGEFGEKWIHAHVWLRVPESITTLLTGYMSIQNKKLKEKKRRSVGYVAKRPEFNDSFKPS